MSQRPLEQYLYYLSTRHLYHCPKDLFLLSTDSSRLNLNIKDLRSPEKILHCQITLKNTLHHRLSTSYPEDRLLSVMESPRKELMSALST